MSEGLIDGAAGRGHAVAPSGELEGQVLQGERPQDSIYHIFYSDL